MKTILSLSFAASLAIGIAQGSILTLDPSSGAISGSPGATVGWGFDLTADPVDWITIIGTVVLGETNPDMGVFTDFISPQGGPGDGELAPAAPDWIQTFDPATFTGFGSYAIDPSATIGVPDSGMFLVLYELYSGDPATCLNCFVSAGTFMESFTVNAVAPAPEPSGTGMLLTGAGLIALASWIKRRSPAKTRPASMPGRAFTRAVRP